MRLPPRGLPPVVSSEVDRGRSCPGQHKQKLDALSATLAVGVLVSEELPRLESFLKALATETAWEWKWEKRHRHWGWGINWATWFSRLLILALAWFQWTAGAKSTPPAWVPFSLALLAMLNVALPLLTYTFRFQQRQEVHDGNAREYECIKIELDAGRIDLSAAVDRFTQRRRQPTEKVIRGTP